MTLEPPVTQITIMSRFTILDVAKFVVLNSISAEKSQIFHVMYVFWYLVAFLVTC